jgi:hypothetical protein
MDLPAAITTNRLKWWFWIFFLVTLIFIIWMKRYLLPLQSAEVIRFEMAKTTENAAAMIKEWKENGKFGLVVKNVYLDYIFIVLYTTGIAIACRFLSGLTQNIILRKAGYFFSFFIFGAGIFDVAENMAMMKSLGQSVTETNVGFAYKMAISKFSIVLMVLLFIVVCVVSWLVNQLSRKEKFWK